MDFITGTRAEECCDVAAPAGIWFAGRTDLPLAFIGAAVLFLPLFVFLPKVIQSGMKTDTDVAIEAFGKNEQMNKVLRAPLRRNGRAGTRPGAGPGDSSADCRAYHVGGTVISRVFTRKTKLVWVGTAKM